MAFRTQSCLIAGLAVAGRLRPAAAGVAIGRDASAPLNVTTIWRRPFRPYSRSGSSDRYIPQPNISQQAGRLRNLGCLTTTDDLDGLEQLGAKLGFRQPVDSGASIKPTAVHVGILTSMSDVTRATVFFRNLGYSTRTIGAEQLGRRFYIGPFVSEGAMSEAIATAEQAGFIAPYPSTYFRFWPWRN